MCRTSKCTLWYGVFVFVVPAHPPPFFIPRTRAVSFVHHHSRTHIVMRQTEKEKSCLPSVKHTCVRFSFALHKIICLLNFVHVRACDRCESVMWCLRTRLLRVGRQMHQFRSVHAGDERVSWLGHVEKERAGHCGRMWRLSECACGEWCMR